MVGAPFETRKVLMPPVIPDAAQAAGGNLEKSQLDTIAARREVPDRR